MAVSSRLWSTCAPPPPTPLAPPQVQVTKLMEGFAFGVKMAFLSDGRLRITETVAVSCLDQTGSSMSAWANSNDIYGPALRGRVLMSTFGKGQVLQFALDNATRSTAVGIGPFVEGLPNLVDLQFGADGRLYVLTIRALYRIEPVSSK